MSDAQQAPGAQPQGATATAEVSEVAKLLAGKLNTKGTSELEQQLQALFSHAVKGKVVSADAVKTIEGLLAGIDRQLSAQANAILHHPEFQKMESTWRGLYQFVSNTDTGKLMKIKVLNVSKKELGKTFERFEGVKWDQSPLFKKIYNQGIDQLGADPVGCLIGDYYFDHSGPDVAILRGMARLASAAHAPFLSAAAPTLFGFQSWAEINNPADLTAKLRGPQYADWDAYRKLEDSRYVGLTLPRFLARKPYGPQTNRVEEFAFEETTDGNAENYVWANAAYAMATNVATAFGKYGWCSRIRGPASGGTVRNLATHAFSVAGSMQMRGPTEVAIPETRDKAVEDCGLISMCLRQGTSEAVFMSAHSTHLPQKFDNNPTATGNAQLSAKLPYIFATCRFAHYLKVMVRESVGGTKTREQLRAWLQDWVTQYVHGDPDNASEEEKAKRPLAEARVVVEDVEGRPGYYNATFHLKPHFQLEGLSASLRLVTRLPQPKGS